MGRGLEELNSALLAFFLPPIDQYQQGLFKCFILLSDYPFFSPLERGGCLGTVRGSRDLTTYNR